ncbi:hypothetical protein LSCM1_04335 [Leishmania martiniquensis]|uniref:Uncharacterized protein n=1 Tax=Leishmania martiniquensis TaxID=1580590 RepID=A0A836KGX9_9TRYP|nr:hypothetical protein LSCM1_04335 [Leishmania martiniquensis]
MGSSVGDEARQRNGIAVERIFQKSSSQCARAVAQTHRDREERSTARAKSGGLGGCDSTGPAFRIPFTSAAALVGIAGGVGRGARPAWCDPHRRGPLSRPSLDVSSYLRRQMEEIGHAGKAPPAQQQPLQACGAPAKLSASAASQEEAGAARRSCFLLALQKSKHERGIDARPADAALTPYEALKERWKAYHHQQAVLRHEQTIPRRRAVDPYVHLTGAQVGASLTVPNTYTADRIAERRGGRWVLDNPHHQQLCKGEPVMTRIMRGEFYDEGAARRAAGVPRFDLLAKNRRDVRVTSAINRAERQRRQLPSCTCVCSK